jgi:hypothetical protein
MFFQYFQACLASQVDTLTPIHYVLSLKTRSWKTQHHLVCSSSPGPPGKANSPLCKDGSTEDIRDTIENKTEELLATIERAEVTLGFLKTQRD